MKLHEDKNAFRVLIEQIHLRTGYRSDVLEKDYYVVLMLQELAEKQHAGLPAYFKGGTALYKAIKTTNRFSEDIDISVDSRDCSRTQNDKRLEHATKKYKSLTRDSSLGRTNRSEVVAVYSYDPISPYDANDTLQRFGKLKIEATSFTISEPIESLEVSPLIYECATDNEKKILQEKYEVAPFEIMTITMERIFIDKLFAAEAYVRQSSEPHRAFEAAKHIYDLSVMIHQPQIIKLLKDEEQMKKLLDIRMEEEAGRLDGIPGVVPSEFSFFDDAATDDAVREAYSVMQEQYVFRPKDRIDYNNALEALKTIKKSLEKNKTWMHYKLSIKLVLQLKAEEAERINSNSLERHKRESYER